MSNLRSDSKTTRPPRDAPADRAEEAAAATAVPPAPPPPQQRAPLILGLDTATEMRSVVVVRGGRVLARTGGRVLRENSARVLNDIDEALTAAGVKLEDVELFAAAIGPGSFTGLRSGLATVKAFAATLNRPVAGVPTLHAIAHASGPAPRVLACLPAGRGEVFAQLLSVGHGDDDDDAAAAAAGAVSELGGPFHLSPAATFEAAATWGGDLRWAGGGAHAHAGALREFAAGRGIIWREEGARAGEANSGDTGPSWALAPPSEFYATQVAALGLMKYLGASTLVAEELQALYVRLSDAELNERCRA